MCLQPPSSSMLCRCWVQCITELVWVGSEDHRERWERAGLSPASCRSRDVCTRFYSFKTQGNVSLHLGPAFLVVPSNSKSLITIFFLVPLTFAGSFAIGRVTNSVRIRVYDFEECSYFQRNPTPALQALQEHGSAGQQMCEQPIAISL